MLCGLISPVSELLLKAKCLGDWEMVAMEVQADLWQLSKETEHHVLAWPGLLAWVPPYGFQGPNDLADTCPSASLLCLCSLSEKKTRAQRS